VKTITNKILCTIVAICILAFSAFALAPPGNLPAGEKTVKSKTVKSDPAGKVYKVTVETPVEAAEAAAETDIIKSAAREPVIFRAAAIYETVQYADRDKKPDIVLSRSAVNKRTGHTKAFVGFGADNNARAKI